MKWNFILYRAKNVFIKILQLNRHAKPEEIAALFVFLASSEASYITGQAISIDGGETAGQCLKALWKTS